MISIISSRNHCQRFSSSYISDTPQPGFEPAHRLNSGFVEWIWAVPLNPIPQRQTADLVTFTKEIRDGKSQYVTTKILVAVCLPVLLKQQDPVYAAYHKQR